MDKLNDDDNVSAKFAVRSFRLPVPEIIDCSFGLGLRTSNLGDGEAVGIESGMVPFERALVSSYTV